MRINYFIFSLSVFGLIVIPLTFFDIIEHDLGYFTGIGTAMLIVILLVIKRISK